MTVFRPGRPNVKRLRRRRDAAGLQTALAYRREQVDYQGQTRDTATDVRLAALEALTDFEAEDVAEHLLIAVEDPQTVVRAAAIGVAREMGVTACADPLARGLATWPDDPHARAREAAAEALSEWRVSGVAETFALELTTGAPDGVEEDRDAPLLATLLEADPRGAAAVRPVIASALVDRLLDDEASDRARSEAAEVVTWLGADAADSLYRALAEASPSLIAVGLAGRLRDNRLLEPLVMLCEHQDPSRRAGAAQALGKIQDTRAVAALMRRTQDESHAVRETALAALDEFGVSGVVFGLAAGAQQPLLSGDAEAMRALNEGGEG